MRGQFSAVRSSAYVCSGSSGEDGPSQMGLEDLALFRSIPTATVFYPSDGVSTEKAVELAANTKVPTILSEPHIHSVGGS